MIVKSETLVKAEILTRGVVFSDSSLLKALNEDAKGQNLVYNIPLNTSSFRPQELLIEGLDGYNTVASCVAPNGRISPVIITTDSSDNLIAVIDGKILPNVKIKYVSKPKYYDKIMTNGENVKKYVSACGLDELNILPWKGCAITKGCKFCGVNTIVNRSETDLFNAFSISENHDIWEDNKNRYLSNLKEALQIAIKDECYNEHVHLILISGNLSNESLDKQADIYCDISKSISNDLKARISEGIVAVMTPPKDLLKLEKMKSVGIDIAVFNLEVGNEPWFSRYCPGKKELGLDFFYERLVRAVDIFGFGNVWTNFVLGLEPIDMLLSVCNRLGRQGIVAGANVLHLDEGNKLNCPVPIKDDVLYFYYKLSEIYNSYGFKPYYCSKALRTSLANEAYDKRIIY